MQPRLRSTGLILPSYKLLANMLLSEFGPTQVQTGRPMLRLPVSFGQNHISHPVTLMDPILQITQKKVSLGKSCCCIKMQNVDAKGQVLIHANIWRFVLKFSTLQLAEHFLFQVGVKISKDGPEMSRISLRGHWGLSGSNENTELQPKCFITGWCHVEWVLLNRLSNRRD